MAISAGIQVPTQKGFIMVKDLSEGDVVYDIDGKETKIIEKTLRHSEFNIELEFNKNERFIVSDDQLICALYLERGRLISKKEDVQLISALDMYSLKVKHWTIRVPTVTVEGSGKLVIDPYLFGLWLGDGITVNSIISSHRDDVEFIRQYIENSGYKVGAVKIEHGFAARIGIGNGFRRHLREIGVLGNKHLPEEVYGLCKDYRLALLQGLMDSDGTVHEDRAIFGNTNKNLSLGCARIASSLGEVVNFYSIAYKGFGKEGIAYMVGWQPRTIPCKFPRKIAKFGTTKLPNNRTVRKYSLEIGEAGDFYEIKTESGTIAISNSYIPIGAGCQGLISKTIANRMILDRGMQKGKQIKIENIRDAIKRLKGTPYKVSEDRGYVKKEVYRRILYVDGQMCRGYKEAAAKAGCCRGYIETAIRRGYKHIKGHSFSY